MITIAEVIEQYAREAERCDGSMHGVLDRFMAVLIAGKIRALAAQYEGCIVAGGAPVTYLTETELAALKRDGRRAFVLYTEPVSNGLDVPLYRAREAK